jgi:hypothetical protein
MIALSPSEIALSSAFGAFRKAIRELMAGWQNRRRRAGSFAVEILGKRLLSCPIAFAESWRRCKEGFAEERAAVESDVDAVRRNVEQDSADDREAQAREATAAGVVGAWLKNMADDLKAQIIAIDDAIAGLKIEFGHEDIVNQTPIADARFDALVDLIEKLLRTQDKWRDNERLLVFTEYKTTLDYLVRRLYERYERDRILTLFGSGGKEGMEEEDRHLVKQAFNDPAHPVRILLATDAAAEGLNLQRTARYLLHFDCPWNPSKLEQRNGRLDRHGQARDVTVHYFVTDQDQDLAFLAHVIRKADEIREDLGSANELFDEAAHRRLVEGESLSVVQADLDRMVLAARGRAAVDADDTPDTGHEGRAAGEQLQALASELDFDPQSLRETLESALAIRVGRPQIVQWTDGNTFTLSNPSLTGWSEVIDESLRRNTSRQIRGPVARLAFGPEPFLEKVGERQIFCPKPDVMFMHLSHPMIQRALSTLMRRRFPGTGEEVSRWTVRLGGVPRDAESLLLLNIEELAVNDLRETFHHWVRTLIFPIQGSILGKPMRHQPALDLRGSHVTHDARLHTCARDLIEEIQPDLKTFLAGHAVRLTVTLLQELESSGAHARKNEEERYRSRQGEVSSLITENTLAKLEREIERMKVERQQGLLFDEEARLELLDRSIEEKQQEIVRRTRHYEEVRAQLDRERERILKYLLPRRHAMSGEAQVFPVCMEVCFPEGAA